jgi:Uncharacterised nucleotidyltransferase
VTGTRALLPQVLSHPATMARLADDDWDLLVRQAAAAGLLGRVEALAREGGVLDDLDARVQRHLQAAATIAAQQQRAVNWELVQLAKALVDLDGPVLLLKGAAYAAAGLPPAAGRLFSDIDLMVPKAQLAQAESALMLGGWISGHLGDYDQRYYRQWMHEIPPLTHLHRQTVIDLHHAILPPTARLKTRPEPIFARSRPLPGRPRFSIPSPPDLVLHSATHLFHEGEWEHGLRDLVDLDSMLVAFAVAPGFWGELLAAAAELGLGRPLYYGLRYCRMLLGTPVPVEVVDACPDRPSRTGSAVMDRLFIPAFSTAHCSLRQPSAGVASYLLYLRSHWLRMPPQLLVPHLARKAWMENVTKLFERDQSPAAGGGADHTP